MFPKMMQSHHNFIDRSIELLIEQGIPFAKNKYWKDFEKGHKITYDEIKQLNSQQKYKKTEICQEKGFSELDLIIANFEPNRKQYKLITEIILPRELQIRQAYKDGIKHLFKAREIFIKSMYELARMRLFLVKSNMFEDKQLVNTFMKQALIPINKVPFTDRWGIKKEPRKIEFDIDIGLTLDLFEMDTSQLENLKFEAKYDHYEFIQ